MLWVLRFPLLWVSELPLPSAFPAHTAIASGPYMVAPQGQPGGQPGAYPPPAAGQPPGPGAAAYPTGAGVLAQRFATANVTHDGRLTRDQAAVGMPLVAQNFDVIDVDRKGYVTLPEVRYPSQ